MPGEIFRRAFGKSPWMSLIQRAVYPGGLSQVINTLTYERNAPSEANPDWSAVVAIDGQEGGSCLQNQEVIELGSTTRNFQLYRRDLRGPDFCAEDMRSVFSLGQQLDAITNEISQRVVLEWDARDRGEFKKYAQTKVVVNDCFNPTEDTDASGNASYPAAQATQVAGLGLLDKYRFQLIRNGAADSAILTNNGSPVMTVIASPEWIGNMMRVNSDIRQDIRWADSGMGNNARLVKAMGISSVYDGFMFMPDIYMNRYTYAAGVYTAVPQFVRTAATKGWKWDINPTWRTAPYEELFIFDPEVFTQMVPQPITAPAPNFRFNPVSYVGDIQLLNIPDRRCNPLSQIMFHYIRMESASMPKYPWKGVAFIMKRCDPICGNSTSCTS